ncbi:MAG: histidine phosphatase family protein [Deltaproteobacteria bacterium]|jgi:broad specificity phosphatase PhoE|nr:histidine phosphatase family protein [Deltaproteobacteria bacterium]
MELIFVRHAQPEWVKDGRSVLDPPLTELGWTQARAVPEAAQRWKPPTELWVSPTRRTQETAGPLAEWLGLAPNTLPFLEEMRLPREWDGAPADRIGHVLRTARERTLAEWHDGFPGGEGFLAFEGRISGGLKDAFGTLGIRPRPEHPGLFEGPIGEARVVIVGHGGTNAVALSWLLGLPNVPWAWERFVQAHASVSRLKATPMLGGFVFGLREHSDVSHLPAGLRTR